MKTRSQNNTVRVARKIDVLLRAVNETIENNFDEFLTGREDQTEMADIEAEVRRQLADLLTRVS